MFFLFLSFDSCNERVVWDTVIFYWFCLCDCVIDGELFIYGVLNIY